MLLLEVIFTILIGSIYNTDFHKQYFEGKRFLPLTRRVLLTGFICIVMRHFFLTMKMKITIYLIFII
jgi:hypothetical protein